MDTSTVSRYFNQIEDILDQLSDEEVISLATTITGGVFKNKISSRKDGIKAIINYSEDVPSILRRKLFTRERLLSYLYEKNVAVKLPITKPEIIRKILKLWKYDHENFDMGAGSVDNDNTSEICLEDSSGDSSISPRNEPESIIQEVVAPSQSNEVGRHTTELDVCNTVITLAEQFSQWFYKLLNDNQLSAEHFFPDASLNLTLISNGVTNSNNVVDDPGAITSCLLSTKIQYELFFNPNLSREGLKGQMDPHGLVMVIVCGTLHSKNICVGVFEQMFALARDPFAENNWKIKRTDLRLKSTNDGNEPPKLCDTNVISSSNNVAVTD